MNEIENRPAIRIYVGGKEIDDAPPTEEAATTLVKAALVGSPAGTRGRMDVLRHPTRRGAHAYETAAEWVVDADGRPA